MLEFRCIYFDSRIKFVSLHRRRFDVWFRLKHLHPPEKTAQRALMVCTNAGYLQPSFRLPLLVYLRLSPILMHRFLQRRLYARIMLENAFIIGAHLYMGISLAAARCYFVRGALGVHAGRNNPAANNEARVHAHAVQLFTCAMPKDQKVYGEAKVKFSQCANKRTNQWR